MRDLNRYYRECRQMLLALGIPVREAAVAADTRKRRTWGNCRRDVFGNYTITVNQIFLEETNSDYGLKDTLMHELLHTCPGCLNHGPEWQYWAERVNRAYGYHIKRTSNAEEKRVKDNADDGRPVYHLKCLHCGQDIVKFRMCESVRHPEDFRCGRCGGNLIRTK